METLIDTGWVGEDGMVETSPAMKNDTGTAHLPECVWDGETYTNFDLALRDRKLYGVEPSILGLGFLSRHLVTLNFPKQILHLKQTSVGPLLDGEFKKAVEFMHNLKIKSQQPSWTKDDRGDSAWTDESAKTFTIHLVKKGNSSIYHYMIAKASNDGPCKLLKAWRTDQNGHTVEEYPVP